MYTHMQDDGLPEHLRRNVCEFIRVAFVENDEYMKVTRNTGVAIWRDLAASEKFPSSIKTLGGPINAKGSFGVDEDKRTHALSELKNTIKNYFALVRVLDGCVYMHVMKRS